MKQPEDTRTLELPLPLPARDLGAVHNAQAHAAGRDAEGPRPGRGDPVGASSAVGPKRELCVDHVGALHQGRCASQLGTVTAQLVVLTALVLGAGPRFGTARGSRPLDGGAGWLDGSRSTRVSSCPHRRRRSRVLSVLVRLREASHEEGRSDHQALQARRS